jgi:fluoride exporter
LKAFLLFLGGGLGTYVRWWLGSWIAAQPWTRGLPIGTFFINVSGSFILGAAAVLILERLPPEHQDWYLLVGTGFCGGYTTFSTFEWETFKLVRDGSWMVALANVAGSVLAGFVAVVLAVMLVRAILPR